MQIWDFDRIWMLEDPLLRGPFRADYKLDDGETLRLSAFNLAPPPERTIRLTHGSGSASPQDIVWPRAVMPPFVSDRIISLLHQHQVSGWDSFPIEISDKQGKIHTGFHRLVITARPCGPIDWARGVPFERTKVPLGRYYRGGWFDPSSWDGSDVFRTVQGGWILVVERVRDLFIASKIKNVAFTRLSEYEISESVIQKR